MQPGPLLFGALVAFGVLLAFVGLGRRLSQRDPVEERLAGYAGQAADVATVSAPPRSRFPILNRLIYSFNLGPRLAAALSRADVPMTAAEFAAIVVVAALLGFLIGFWRAGALFGLALAVAASLLPLWYLRRRQQKRRRAFTDQIPDALTLLVGALRAGYGLTQAMDVLVQQMPAPASQEFGRVLRAVSLGVPVQRALSDMARRVDSDDLDMVVTAIQVQYEVGGNLAQTLDTISETVRERIRLLREIRVLTAQQRLTGYILAGLPIFLVVALFVINPEYIAPLFSPQSIWLPLVGLGMMFLGFLVIRRIVDIEV